MRAASYVVALFSALFLIAAAVAWWNVVRQSDDEGAADRLELHLRRVKSAAGLTAIALGLSGVAAIMAVTGWILR